MSKVKHKRVTAKPTQIPKGEIRLVKVGDGFEIYAGDNSDNAVKAGYLPLKGGEVETLSITKALAIPTGSPSDNGVTPETGKTYIYFLD